MTFNYSNINQYEANSEFHFLYSEIKDHFFELESFLKHIHGFVSLTENKLDENFKVYSHEFFEYYYARSYGETFRSSFIVTVCSVSEAYIKCFVETWKSLFRIESDYSKIENGILDYLKKMDKNVFKINVDFSKKEIVEFRSLLYVRNAIVHSSGTLDYVSKYENQIRKLSKSYPSLHISEQGYLRTDHDFCNVCLQISKQFFFYIFRISIRKFPDYNLYNTFDFRN